MKYIILAATVIILSLTAWGLTSDTYEMSTKDLKEAALSGSSEAQNYLGFRFYNGNDVEQNVDSALYWIGKAAENGNVKAAGNLGYLLSHAPDVPHDYDKAFLWLKIAADASLPQSFTQLGDLYRQGLGCETDTLKAIEFYEKGINAHVADAELRLLAMMGYKWKELPLDSAFSLGYRYYTKGAPIAGVDLLENAASQGSVKAMALLGDAYSRGIGVPYNHDISVDYFTKAAMLGNPSAQYILAELLDIFPDILDEKTESSLDLMPDIETQELNSAIYWYEMAKKQGVEDAETAYRLLFEP